MAYDLKDRLAGIEGVEVHGSIWITQHVRCVDPAAFIRLKELSVETAKDAPLQERLRLAFEGVPIYVGECTCPTV